MNKQELIDKYEYEVKLLRLQFGEIFKVKVYEELLDYLKQLDEPQRVKVPQCVGDFITEQKKLGHTLSYSIDACMSDRVGEWYWDNSELFAQAWIFGYTVEKEKRYTVVMKATKQPLYYNAVDKKLFFSMGGLATNFTKKQLEKAGFGEVFDSQLFEIEEVKG